MILAPAILPRALGFSPAASGRGCVKTRSKIAIVGQRYTPQRNRIDAILLRTTIERLTTIR